MTRVHPFKQWVTLAAAFLLYPASAVAGAKEDLSIATKGTCSAGGTAFTITNNHSSNGIHATVTQSTEDSGKTTVSTLDISLQPKEEKVLGCSSQSSAGNFLTTWQVQSAQYQ
jgi:hypothetical protein